MNKHYQKFKKNYYYKNKLYNNYKKGYYHKKYQYDNSYGAPYENIYEEEISYDKKTMESFNDPKETSFSQSSKSTSRKQSISDNNDNISCESNKETSFIIIDNNTSNNSNQNFTKINLSESELETAFYKPKNYKSDSVKKAESKSMGENIVILDINVKISDNKSINFQLRKFDDMVQLVKDTCKKNELGEDYANFFIYKIIKALNSIYGIYNLPLKKEEIEFLKNLKDN
jgi:hypothetical protein